MQVEKLITTIATALEQRANCVKSGNSLWKERAESRLKMIAEELLPNGAGIDSGTKVDITTAGPSIASSSLRP
jgi:hypothetical protein